MDHVLQDLPFCRCYIDDIVIWSRNLEEHLEHIKMVLERLRKAGLKVHPGKCVFGADNIDFLGHRISANKLEPHNPPRILMGSLAVVVRARYVESAFYFKNKAIT